MYYIDKLMQVDRKKAGFEGTEFFRQKKTSSEVNLHNNRN